MVVMVPQMHLIVTSSEDKVLFFFKFLTTDKGIKMDPLRCIIMPHVTINLQWIPVSEVRLAEEWNS